MRYIRNLLNQVPPLEALPNVYMYTVEFLCNSFGLLVVWLVWRVFILFTRCVFVLKGGMGVEYTAYTTYKSRLAHLRFPQILNINQPTFDNKLKYNIIWKKYLFIGLTALNVLSCLRGLNMFLVLL